MQPRIIMALLALAAGAPSASASVIGLDLVLVGNPDPIAGDGFDNGVFDGWLVVSGAPSPEAGTTLTMRGGDFILLGVPTNPLLDTSAFASMELTDFPAGSVASLIVFGDTPGELLSLGVAPGAAFLSDGLGAVLGIAALPPSPTANLLINIGANDSLVASVDGVIVYDQVLDFGPVTAVGISVVPEPATLGLLGLGCLFMGVRRRLAHTRG